MCKIGLLGGTFDPIHNGHLLAAQAAQEAAQLDGVWFIPTQSPPHKPNPGTNSSLRKRMLQEAVASNSAFRIEDIELRREGTSYTFDTVAALQEQYPDHQFYWIVGSDMVEDLPNWHRIHDLARRVSFIGLERPDQPVTSSLPEFIGSQLQWAAMPRVEISSSAIRRKLKEGCSVRYMVPDAVLDFIQRNGLYEA